MKTIYMKYKYHYLFNKKQFTILINLVNFIIQKNSKCKYNNKKEPKKLPKKRDDYLEQAIYNYRPIAVGVLISDKLTAYK